ncbi:sugar transferase [Aquibaculum arenosum]|uniref:Sugar transferase n=1 Tax=Aquibaculum arenosum TaxID=3032591 RepID=A0ABT5YLI7_9PROT|nr:sugar transferase [Fodinicurvata sp. CAU 1616]MDF2095822.1 sugar transferase [Fodinicurvata sp. CAU 1616]
MSTTEGRGFYRRHGKRLLDITGAGLGLILLGPLLLGVALAVRIGIGGPVLFRQWRPGFLGLPFLLIKFRSMTGERDALGRLLPDARRLTRLGRFLRASSLDELPELWNVLRGDMSLVGPRPLLVEYLPLYSPEQMRRHDVRPGITGWAQVNGRNALTWEEKFALDLWYVDNCSFLVDVKILLRTLVRVFARDGIGHGEEATMPWFTGSHG